MVKYLTAAELVYLTEGRNLIRETAGNINARPLTIKLKNGKSPPEIVGESYCWKTIGGRDIYYPIAYSKRGWSSMVYHPSSLEIEVGMGWRAKININPTKMSFLEMKLKRDLNINLVRKINDDSNIRYYLLDNSGHSIGFDNLTAPKVKKAMQKILNMPSFL